MEFVQDTLPSGLLRNSGQWDSDCGEYVIHRSSYVQKWGGTYRRKVWEPCTPHFRAYRTCDGKALQGGGVRLTLEQAIELCEKHKKGGKR